MPLARLAVRVEPAGQVGAAPPDEPVLPDELLPDPPELPVVEPEDVDALDDPLEPAVPELELLAPVEPAVVLPPVVVGPAGAVAWQPSNVSAAVSPQASGPPVRRKSLVIGIPSDAFQGDRFSPGASTGKRGLRRIWVWRGQALCRRRWKIPAVQKWLSQARLPPAGR